MWHWDQGRLAYFQFDALKRIAEFVVHNDFRIVNRTTLLTNTGLPFSAPETHSPWRNYSRILKLCLLVRENKGVAEATSIAQLLAQPGAVTCDEYWHFLIQSFTEPSPALKDWTPNSNFRYPLLFAIKYLLAKSAISPDPITEMDEIIGAYAYSNFTGEEVDEDFIKLLGKKQDYSSIASSIPDNLRRQARESLKVIAQISYLHCHGAQIIVSLAPEDAQQIFQDLAAIAGQRASTGDEEIARLAEFFSEGSTDVRIHRVVYIFKNSKKSFTRIYVVVFLEFLSKYSSNFS